MRDSRTTPLQQKVLISIYLRGKSELYSVGSVREVTCDRSISYCGAETETQVSSAYMVQKSTIYFVVSSNIAIS